MAEGARRLWHMDPVAHEVLVASSFAPSQLRALLARALGRLRAAHCVVQGSDADVLYSAVHDLDTRNAVSETLHQSLQRRHAAEATRWRRLHGVPALQQAWDRAMAASEGQLPVAALWALLTHPEGRELDGPALCAFRQRAWALAQKAAFGCQRESQAEAAAAAQRQQAETLRQRLLALQREHSQLQHQLKVAQAEARGAAQRALAVETLQHDVRQAAATVARAAFVQASGEDKASAASPESRPVVRALGGGARPRQSAMSLNAVAAQSGPDAGYAATSPVRHAPSVSHRPAPAVAGRRVLCVGGMPGARQRYRALLEAAGARFHYHDGGLEDSVARLDSHLVAADVVVCHSGCLNHEAYRRIKGHCQQTDKPCVYLPRPSLSAFARGLGLDARRPGANVSCAKPAPIEPTDAPHGAVAEHPEGQA